MNNLTKTDYQHALNIKTFLKEHHGDLVDCLYCYGSRVSQQQTDTDFDLLVITSRKIDWQMEDRISSEIYYYGLENDILFDVRYFSNEEFESKYRFMPFITEVKNYGIAV